MKGSGPPVLASMTLLSTGDSKISDNPNAISG